MRIGLLGGSFDPIHNGHLKMAKNARKQLQLDEVWFLPTFNAPLKSGHHASFEHRVAMISCAIAPYSYCKICTVERQLKSTSYTIHTIRHLTKAYPMHSFYFIIGADQVTQLHKWKDIECLQKEVQLCAFARGERSVESPYNVQALYMPACEASSSDVRKGIFTHLPKGVIQYIHTKGLYLEWMAACVSQYRYDHSLRVARLAAHIASCNRLNTHKAYMSGLLHDLNKEWSLLSEEESVKVLAVMKPELLLMDTQVWHAYTAAFVLKHQLQYRDNDVLTAIAHHVLGDSHAVYAKVLYVADKLEPNRAYDVSKATALCCHNIHEGYKYVHQQQKEYYGDEKNNGK